MSEVIKKINVDGVEYDIQGKELTKVTYAELKSLRDNGELVEGHLYRITDYEFTTVQSETKSAGHVFDIIVLATSANELSHIARAIAHEGDTYFDGNDLGAWELWYDLDNDTEKYEWADAENGKGVIYRMIDEKRNDCPYDFKNALFFNDKLTTDTTSDKYYYTFSYVVSGVLYDGTVEKQVTTCYGNSMGTLILSGKRKLNENVWRNTHLTEKCFDNTFKNKCYINTFESNCHSNTFGDNCFNNTFGDDNSSNIFGDNCNRNIFGDNCNRNIFGDNCINNVFEYSCYLNTLGKGCYGNTFRSNCQNNSFGSNCQNNSFGDNIKNRKIDYSKTSITLNDEYYDDGSGQLVPVKHPDLSTQPSVLPYKFMGNYVYEQLIPIGAADSLDDLTSMGVDLTSVLGANVVILSLNGFANVKIVNSLSLKSRVLGVPLKAKSLYADGGLSHFKLSVESELTLENSDVITYGEVVFAYVRVVYTSMPEDSSYYGLEQGGLSLPQEGYIFAIPQDYGIESVDYIDDYSGTDANITAGTLIGTQNGLDYWHIDKDVRVNSYDSFSIQGGTGTGSELEAKVYKDFNTDITDLANWKQDTGSRYYVLSKHNIPDKQKMTSIFIKIL